MEKIPVTPVQEILFGTSDRKASARISTLEKQGTIKKIAPKIYTTNLNDEPAKIIRRNWYRILSNHYPQALLSHRTALEFRPTKGGHIYLTYSYSRLVELPGITIHLLQGTGKIEGDNLFFENLYVAQEARAYLENFQLSRKKSERSKTLPETEIEEKLETIIRVKGEKALNDLRDKAREIAPILGFDKEYIKLNRLISNLLTGNVQKLQSPVAKARALGEPFDPSRIKLFEKLYEELAGAVFPEYKDQNITPPSYSNFAFFESYFSNYIEGTEFTITEAKTIINSDSPLPARNEDSHDILGTYHIVNDKKNMSQLPGNPVQLLDILKDRHAVLLRARHSKNPGIFKHINNRAGSTEFVDWQLVTGTLKKGFDWYSLLQHPFARAIYMMFMISEVHPFLDGNGRIARVMMNAELTAKGMSKIIIPTVYRDDYMGALKKLTKQQMFDAYTRMLLRAFEFSAHVHDENLEKMEQYLVACNAFKEPKEGKLAMAPQKKM